MSPMISSSSTAAVDSFAGMTSANAATAKDPNPLTEVFEMPTTSAATISRRPERLRRSGTVDHGTPGS